MRLKPRKASKEIFLENFKGPLIKAREEPLSKFGQKINKRGLDKTDWELFIRV